MAVVMYGEPDVEYTKCHECGLWDDEHEIGCISGARWAYITGRIEIDEFERRLDDAMHAEPCMQSCSPPVGGRACEHATSRRDD